MSCFVYRSVRRAETYVYLARRDDFDCLPAALRAPLGELAFVMALDLAPPRRLAREDVEVVRANLAGRGFHIQFPPPIEAPDGD